MRLLVVLVAVVAVVAWLATRPAATRDTFAYGRPPSWIAWRLLVEPFLRFKHAVKLLDPPFVATMNAIGSAQLPFVLATLCERNVPDVLIDGPMTVRDLAAKTRSNGPNLYRLLRRAVVDGFFRELPGDTRGDLLSHRFENTPMSHALSAAHEPSPRWMLLHAVHDIFPTFARLPETLDRADANPFGETHGVAGDNWAYFSRNAERGAVFNKAMESLEGMGSVAVDFPFGDYCDAIVDYGGGKGRLLHAILTQFPSIKHGVLFDTPSVIKEARERWDTYHHLAHVHFVGGSFFDNSTEPLCRTPRCCVVMRAILHDWLDDQASAILHGLHARLHAGDRLIIVEPLPSEYVVPGLDWLHAMADITMLMFQGKERTADEMNALLVPAGFSPLNVSVTRSPVRLGLSIAH